MLGIVDRIKSMLFAEDDYGIPGEEYEEQPPTPRRKDRLIRLNSRSGEIFIRRPKNQEEAKICIDCLRGRRAVVINLKDVQPEHALRVFDFLTGATYALGGQIEQAGDGVYLLTPQNIGVMAEEETTASTPSSDVWQEL